MMLSFHFNQWANNFSVNFFSDLKKQFRGFKFHYIEKYLPLFIS